MGLGVLLFIVLVEGSGERGSKCKFKVDVFGFIVFEIIVFCVFGFYFFFKLRLC